MTGVFVYLGIGHLLFLFILAVNIEKSNNGRSFIEAPIDFFWLGRIWLMLVLIWPFLIISEYFRDKEIDKNMKHGNFNS